jgi:hypothetical protein
MTRALHTHPIADSHSSTAALVAPPSTTAKILRRGCSLVAFLLPLKLSLTYIALIPLILYWGYGHRFGLVTPRLPNSARAVAAPLCLFLALAVLSSAVGVSPTHSIPALVSLLFFVLTVPLFATCAQTSSVCLALIAGQTLAAFHSFLDAALPGTLPSLFLGKVTESGQLSITIPLTLGVIVSNFRNSPHSIQEWRALQRWRLPLLAVTITATLTLLGFQRDLQLSSPAIVTLIAAVSACLLLAWQCVKPPLTTAVRQQLALIVLSLPLLTCALLVNLKRGPWLGVLVGTGCFLLVYARRLVLPLACGAVLLALDITPIRERLLASYEHFTIAGGRSTIWRIGAELASEYPLGIGYHNSGILREFAPEIPAELKHFHNNLLNIAAETGWLGVFVFVWLLVAIVKTSLRDRSAPLFVAIGCAVISWQVAGFVEYNFGDSEVTILVWTLLGLLFLRDLNRLDETQANTAC